MVNRVKVFRESINLSQATLSKELGVTQKRISQIESGLVDPTVNEINKLTSILKHSFEEIFVIEKQEQCKNALIKYKELEDHVDPNFTHLVYGDAAGKRSSRLNNIVQKGSYVFFHTSYNGTEYITGFYYVDRILKKGRDDDEIQKLNCDAKYDDTIIIGDRNKSKIFNIPIVFDKKLAIELTSLEITEEDFNEGKYGDLRVISDRTREHRELSNIDTQILIEKSKKK